MSREVRVARATRRHAHAVISVVLAPSTPPEDVEAVIREAADAAVEDAFGYLGVRPGHVAGQLDLGCDG